MKSQDILILLKLISLERAQSSGRNGELEKGFSIESFREAYSLRGLEASLGISKSEISNSFKRCMFSMLASKAIRGDAGIRVNAKELYEFIVSGLRFVFPVKPGAITRGVLTASSAPVLSGLLTPGEYGFVWPYAHGKDQGQSIEPLFKSVPEAANNDPYLYEMLALVDAIRIGRSRERNLAQDLLKERMLEW